MDTLVSNTPKNISVDCRGLANALAHQAAFDEMIANDTITSEDDMVVGEGYIYTPAAQEVYDRHYSYFMESIFNYAAE